MQIFFLSRRKISKVAFVVAHTLDRWRQSFSALILEVLKFGQLWQSNDILALGSFLVGIFFYDHGGLESTEIQKKNAWV